MTIIMGFIFIVLWFGSTTFLKKRLYPSCLTNFILPMYMFKFVFCLFVSENEKWDINSSAHVDLKIISFWSFLMITWLVKKKKNIYIYIYMPNGFFTILKVSFVEGNGKPLQCSYLENPSNRGEPGGLPSVGSHRVRHNWNDLAAAAAAKVSFLWLLASILPDWNIWSWSYSFYFISNHFIRNFVLKV